MLRRVVLARRYALNPSLARSIAGALVLTLSACGNGDSPSGPPSTLRDVEVVAVSAHNARVTWAPAPDGDVVIERAVAGSGSFTEVGRKNAAHGRFLDLALTPESSYSYRLMLCTAGGCEEPSDARTVTTPATEFVSLEITVPPDGTADDLVLFGAYRVAADVFKSGHMAAVDRHGNVVWEYATHEWGPITEVEPLSDHTIATGQYMSLVQIDLDGSEVYRWKGGTAEHDIDRLSDGRFALLFFDPFETEPGYTVLGDGIQILNHDGTGVDWQWRARDHIPLTDANQQDLNEVELGLGHDWTHTNAITVDEAANKVYANVRNLNRLYKIDIATGEPDWIMGDGGEFGAGLWDHSHDPQVLDDHHVLLLDNGLRRPGPAFSRVIEVEFDAEAKTASIVWEYRETPDFYSFALGGATKQANGNVLIVDGINGRVLEVTPDKQKVWELRIQTYYWIYKAVTVPWTFFTEW
jgi:hypothetical protein